MKKLVLDVEFISTLYITWDSVLEDLFLELNSQGKSIFFLPKEFFNQIIGELSYFIIPRDFNDSIRMMALIFEILEMFSIEVINTSLYRIFFRTMSHRTLKEQYIPYLALTFYLGTEAYFCTLDNKTNFIDFDQVLNIIDLKDMLDERTILISNSRRKLYDVFNISVASLPSRQIIPTGGWKTHGCASPYGCSRNPRLRGSQVLMPSRFPMRSIQALAMDVGFDDLAKEIKWLSANIFQDLTFEKAPVNLLIAYSDMIRGPSLGFSFPEMVEPNFTSLENVLIALMEGGILQFIPYKLEPKSSSPFTEGMLKEMGFLHKKLLFKTFTIKAEGMRGGVLTIMVAFLIKSSLPDDPVVKIIEALAVELDNFPDTVDVLTRTASDGSTSAFKGMIGRRLDSHFN